MNLAQIRGVDAFMTNLVRTYKNKQFVAGAVLPQVSVTKAGGRYLIGGAESLEISNLVRAPGGTVQEFMLSQSNEPYALEGKALQCKIPFEWLRENEANPGEDLQTRAVNVTMAKVALASEVQSATMLRSATSYLNENVFNLANDAGNKFSDASADPVEFILTKIDSNVTLSGYRPNVAVFGTAAWSAFRRNPAVRGAFAYTADAARPVTAEMAAQLLGVSKVVVGDAIYRNAKGQNISIWGADVVLAYVPDGAMGTEEPGFGYKLTMEGHPLVLDRHEDKDQLCFKYPVLLEETSVVTMKECGVLIKNVA